ncbi:MAG TPA: glycosyltransferase [Rhizobiaceae bacterium]|nr:glycosyltransferase [Rhizobiaceae bacterium]
MKIVVFGLSISSSWGNGHATLWRGLVRSLTRRGWHVVFFEKDVPYYASTRDLFSIEGGELILYPDWESAVSQARSHIADADVAMVTSYCPDGVSASELIFDTACPAKIFYDLDTPVTLSAVERGEALSYIGPRGLRDFDLVLSYTGGTALDLLRTRLGAGHVWPLFGHVDPTVHRPSAPKSQYAADLSYIGTYAADRQQALVELLLDPARRRPDMRFVIAGAQYPEDFPWTENIFFVRHLPPEEHPAFYSSSRLTLNITRRAMADMGWCPSGRLFEAAACAAPILADWWRGLDDFFTPGREILVARNAEDATAALDMNDAELKRIAARARERVLDEHTSDRRAAEFEMIIDNVGNASANKQALQA